MYLPNTFNYDPTIISSIGCKIYQFYNYGMDAISPWILVYISIEKYISIAFPTKRFLLKKTRSQIIFFILLCVFNIIYHINLPFSFDLISVNNQTVCYFINEESQTIVSYMDLVNFFLFPFILMIFSSNMLIFIIFKSRNRVNHNNSEKENKRLKQDIKFSITSLSMNLLFLILNLPIDIIEFLPLYNNNELYMIFWYIFNISSATNFYLILFTNSLFRREFVSLFIRQKVDGNHSIRPTLHETAF